MPLVKEAYRELLARTQAHEDQFQQRSGGVAWLEEKDGQEFLFRQAGVDLLELREVMAEIGPYYSDILVDLMMRENPVQAIAEVISSVGIYFFAMGIIFHEQGSTDPREES